jgi:hypothetical protein
MGNAEFGKSCDGDLSSVVGAARDVLPQRKRIMSNTRSSLSYVIVAVVIIAVR